MKSRKTTFWQWQWNLIGLMVLYVSIPIGIIGALYEFVIKDKFEPEPIHEKYAYNFSETKGLEYVNFYYSKQGAQLANSRYNETLVIQPKPNLYGDFIQLDPNIRIMVLRYSKDSSIAKVKRIKNIYYSDTTFENGWIPSIVLHDSSYIYSLNKLYY